MSEGRSPSLAQGYHLVLFYNQLSCYVVILRQRDTGGESSPHHYPRPANDRFSETDVKITQSSERNDPRLPRASDNNENERVLGS